MFFNTNVMSYRVREARNGTAPGYEMITNIRDPSIYAFANSITYVAAVGGTTKLRIRTQVSLLSQSGGEVTDDTLSPNSLLIQSDVLVYDFNIKNFSIPIDIHQRLQEEIARQSGVALSDFEGSNLCEHVYHILPILRFSFYDEETHVLDVFLDSRDYTVRRDSIDHRPCMIAVESATSGNNYFGGFVFLKNIGVLIDYENRRFGIFDRI